MVSDLPSPLRRVAAEDSVMKKIFIHIGLPKTGTTAIQTYLDSHKEELKNCGYDCIPIDMCHNFALSLLAQSINLDAHSAKKRKKNTLYFCDVFSLSEEYLKSHLNSSYINNIKCFIEKSAAEKIIISSEFFSYASAYDISQENFHKMLLHALPDTDTKFICYVRNIDEMAASFYKELVKEGVNAIQEQNSNLLYIPDTEWIFQNYISGLANGQFSNLVPDTVLNLYAKIGGKKNVVIRKYGDRDSGFDVVADFLSIFSLQKQKNFQKNIPINPSLTKEIAAYRIAYGRDDSPSSEDVGFRSCLARMALNCLGEVDEQTAARLEESAAALRDQYGVDCSFSADALQKRLRAPVSDFELFVCTALGKLSKQNNALLRRFDQQTTAAPPASLPENSICNSFSSPLPDKYTYQSHINKIFDSRWLTSRGPYVQALEHALSDFLQVPHVLCCANDSLMLMLVLELENLAGKKIALSPCAAPRILSVLRWLHCEPVFVDIDEQNLGMSALALEETLIQEQDIAAVIASHAFGICCNVEELSRCCQQHGATLIFDAGDAFAATLQGRSLLDFGDYTVCSLHASHIFHTIEGGCIVSHSAQAQKKLEQLRSSGQNGPAHTCYGINAHMSELHASFGLSLLPSVSAGIQHRAAMKAFYDENILHSAGNIRVPAHTLYFQGNNACYPIIMPDISAINAAVQQLNSKNIFPRRPFPPLLTQLPYLESELYRLCPIAEEISPRILCLPIFDELPHQRLQTIIEIIKTYSI